ncbi:MAG: hypothetical protein M4579_006999 [Chaenotheca gracillima]|nr:MAG: hypothetical protein M4579_006999 [Chaenotheca gracillima]
MSSLEAANLFSVKGMVAVITGGGTGIGLMMTKALAINGASKVYIIGRRMDKLEAAAKEHPSIVPIQGDVLSKDSLTAIEQRITSEVGYVNVVIANSGVTGPEPPESLKKDASMQQVRDYWFSQPPEKFTDTFAVNTTGVFYTALAFLPLLDAGNKKGNVQQKSQIIATSSIGGFSRIAPVGPAYGPSKAAVTHLMKQLATSYVDYDIRCNILAPGPYPSDLAGSLFANHSEPGTLPRSFVPAGRAGTDEDMAGAILYLTSRAGGFCNGSVIVTDGGRLGILPSSY